MARRVAAGVVLGIVALAACGDGEGAAPGSGAVTVAAPADAPPATTAEVVAATTRAPEPVESVDTVVAAPSSGGVVFSDGPMWSNAFPMTDYVGAPLEEIASRTTDSGIVVHLQLWPHGGPMTSGDGPGWSPAPWCGSSASLRVTMRMGEAVAVGNSGRQTEPFGGLSVQPFLAGYAEGTPFSVFVVQTASDVDSVAVTVGDGPTDAAEISDGLAILALPWAPEPGDPRMAPQPPDYTLTVYRGVEVVAYPSADLPRPTDADYQRECNPPTELPAPGDQPADPAAADRAVRDAFDAVFDFEARAEGDRSWLAQLDSDEGVEAAIEQVLAGPYGDAAGSADYTMGDLVFTSPTEAWFRYDLFANNNHFDDRFGQAIVVDGVWKLSRGVICQDLALGGGTCDPPIGQLYPPT